MANKLKNSIPYANFSTSVNCKIKINNIKEL